MRNLVLGLCLLTVTTVVSAQPPSTKGIKLEPDTQFKEVKIKIPTYSGDQLQFSPELSQHIQDTADKTIDRLLIWLSIGVVVGLLIMFYIGVKFFAASQQSDNPYADAINDPWVRAKLAQESAGSTPSNDD